ncbi:facilitated trehalose transporter Tret1-like isoform X2 [Homalodisca vitripennis]|nr:facilitated trehalose transporter Tret1-like isoform X2 [Homalodisca vitripennis]
MTSAQTSWVIPIIELGNFITPLPAGILSNYIGRKPLILATGPLYIVSWLLIIFHPSVTMLGAARLLQGLTMGLTYTAAPVYLGEIASKENRGAITSIFLNSWWVGYLTQYAVGPFLSFYNFTYFTLSLNIPFMILFLWQPESPYYHVMCGDIEKARTSLTWFRDATFDELQEELEEIKKNVEANQRSAGFRDLITSSEGRKGLTILLMLAGANILSGTGAITVYATQIFDKTPNLSIPPDVVTIVLGIVMLVGGVVSSFTSDSLGRRPLLITSCIGTFISQFFTGTYYYLLFNTSVEVSSFSWIAPVLILIYSGLCTSGMYPLCSVYTSELFNSNTRGIASSVCAICVTLFSLISLLLYQPVNDYLGLYANFYIYAITILVGGTYCYFNAPETKGKSFVQIREELLKFKQ